MVRDIEKYLRKTKQEKMKLKLYTLYVILFSCIACSNNENKFVKADKIIVIESTNIKDTLHGEIVEYDSLINPTGIEAIDSFVVILSGQTGKLFSVYNSNSNTLVSQFGQIGHSKTEFTEEPITCQLSHSKTNGRINLTVQRPNKNNLSVFDFSKAIENGKLESCNTIKYGSDDTNYNTHYAFSYGDNDYVIYKSILIRDLKDTHPIPPVLYVKDGDKDETIDLFPKAIESSCYELEEYAYFCLPHMKADETKLVNVFSLTDMITITDLNTLETTAITSDDGHSFEYYQSIANESRQTIFDNLVIQNTCYNISDNYIIVCQDHKTKLDDYETMTSYEPIIRIMDWTGTLLYSFHVKEPLMRIAFAESTKKMYGFDMNMKLYCYDLSKYIK